MTIFQGYIISHEWADNNYMFHLNPLLNVIPEKDEIEQHAPLRERWREDLQLLSDFLDYKASFTHQNIYKFYLATNNQETKRLTASCTVL